MLQRRDVNLPVEGLTCPNTKCRKTIKRPLIDHGLKFCEHCEMQLLHIQCARCKTNGVLARGEPLSLSYVPPGWVWVWSQRAEGAIDLICGKCLLPGDRKA